MTNVLATPPPLQMANLFIALLFPSSMCSNLTLTHITGGFSALDMCLLLLLLTYWGHVCWSPCLYSCSYAGKTTCFLAYLGKERNQTYWVNIKQQKVNNKSTNFHKTKYERSETEQVICFRGHILTGLKWSVEPQTVFQSSSWKQTTPTHPQNTTLVIRAYKARTCWYHQPFCLIHPYQILKKIFFKWTNRTIKNHDKTESAAKHERRQERESNDNPAIPDTR